MEKEVKKIRIKEKYANIFPLDLANKQLGLVPEPKSTSSEEEEKEKK